MRLYRVGDSGEPVRDIQGRLSALGFDFAPDHMGEFDAGTRAAVVAFQAARSLDPDGIVGPDTWRSLYEAGFALGDRILFRRSPMMRGDDVADLQRRLNDLGFDADKVDGIFGPLTHRALLDFQANRGMAEDGVAGPLVIRELVAITRGDPAAGRERVREREWMRRLPTTIVGARIYVDPAGPDDAQRTAMWAVGTALQRSFQILGGVPLLSRGVDIYPPASIRARRANRLGAHLAVSLTAPADEESRIYYFRSHHSHSEAGALLAHCVGERLGLAAAGRASAMLKNTRAPAIVIAAELSESEVEPITHGFQDFFGRAAAEFQP